jgi:hypothetical protein
MTWRREIHQAPADEGDCRGQDQHGGELSFLVHVHPSHGQDAIASTPKTTRQSSLTFRGVLAANRAALAANRLYIAGTNSDFLMLLASGCLAIIAAA